MVNKDQYVKIVMMGIEVSTTIKLMRIDRGYYSPSLRLIGKSFGLDSCTCSCL